MLRGARRRGLLAGRKGRFEQALQLVAEAQSSVRAALQRVGSPEDRDQVDVFEWLKATAAPRHVYVKRFMRADDPADPAGWRELLDRIEREDARHGRSGGEATGSDPPRPPPPPAEVHRDRTGHG